MVVSNISKIILSNHQCGMISTAQYPHALQTQMHLDDGLLGDLGPHSLHQKLGRLHTLLFLFSQTCHQKLGEGRGGEGRTLKLIYCHI